MWPWSSSAASSSSSSSPSSGSNTTQIQEPVSEPVVPEPSPMPASYFESIVQEEIAYLNLVHPTVEETPTCINLFDTYLSCNALRNQVKAYYRYGEGPTCSSKLDDWKFCLGVKWLEPEERREKWIRRRAEWWARRRIEGKSSEDVWGSIRKDSEKLQGYPRPLTEEDLAVLKDETPLTEGMF